MAETAPLTKFIAVDLAVQSDPLRYAVALSCHLFPVSRGVPPPGWRALGGLLHWPSLTAVRAESTGDESGLSIPQTISPQEIAIEGLIRKKAPDRSKWR